jgi:large subunit ribosomal protein L30
MIEKQSNPAAGRLRVKQVRSTIGFNKAQALVVRGLGLRRIGHRVEVPDTPAIRGMLHKVRHLVEVESDARAGSGSPEPSGRI